MSADHQKLLNHIGRLAEEGHFGEEAQNVSAVYAELPDGATRCAVCVRDFLTDDVDEAMEWPRSLLCQLIVVAYRLLPAALVDVYQQ